MGPGAEQQLTRLLVEREVGDVDGAGALPHRVRVPRDVPRVVDEQLGVAVVDLDLGTVGATTTCADAHCSLCLSGRA